MFKNINPELLNYGTQKVSKKDIAEVVKVLQSKSLTNGPAIDKFEKLVSKKLKSKFAVSCSSGTAALHLASLTLNLKKNDCVIVPSITFIATANASSFCGAKVVFSDVDKSNGLMTPENFHEAIKKSPRKPRIVYVVHLAGQPVNLLEISKIAKKYNIDIIEDGCHAFGTKFKDENGQHSVGDCYYSKFTTFSFHPIKNITTGEGGCITTNDKKYFNILKCLRSHGMVKTPNNFKDKKQKHSPWYYEMQRLGYNYRLSEIQAALGISQIKQLEQYKKHRQILHNEYENLLIKYKPFITPIKKNKNINACWHLYIVLIDFKTIGLSRSFVMNKLKEKGIGTQVHYIPLNEQPYYKEKKLFLKGSDNYYNQTLSLPLHVKLTKSDIKYVVKNLVEILGIEK